MTDEELSKLLSSFHCSLDSDIEYFLCQKSVEYERLSKARTYLIIDVDQLVKQSIDKAVILGYITIALKVLKIPDDVSNRARKDIDGISAKLHGQRIDAFPVYLIGQLGRNDLIDKNLLSGPRLIQYAQEMIESASQMVGGRYVLIECHNTPKLIRFYTENGFSTFARIADGTHEMLQMLKKI